jgi:DHA1 family multidrug resistance protein-like MFS transporter
VIFMAQFSNIMPAPILSIFVPHLSGVPRLHGQLQTSTIVGIILAMEGICAALSSWHVQRLTNRFGYRAILIGAVALAGVVYAPAFVAQSVWQLVVVRAAEGLCLGAAMPVASAIVGLITPEGRRAAAYGLTASASSFGFALGPLMGGLLGAAFGLRSVFLVTAVMMLVVAGVISATIQEPAEHPLAEAPAPAQPSIRRVVASDSSGRK